MSKKARKQVDDEFLEDMPEEEEEKEFDTVDTDDEEMDEEEYTAPADEEDVPPEYEEDELDDEVMDDGEFEEPPPEDEFTEEEAEEALDAVDDMAEEIEDITKTFTKENAPQSARIMANMVPHLKQTIEWLEDKMIPLENPEIEKLCNKIRKTLSDVADEMEKSYQKMFPDVDMKELMDEVEDTMDNVADMVDGEDEEDEEAFYESDSLLEGDDEVMTVPEDEEEPVPPEVGDEEETDTSDVDELIAERYKRTGKKKKKSRPQPTSTFQSLLKQLTKIEAGLQTPGKK